MKVERKKIVFIFLKSFSTTRWESFLKQEMQKRKGASFFSLTFMKA